ncbi:MAG: MBL fold metallo-hydrolase [Tannerellaceae bacterium]|jgi:glyoxylase-like metal-dependent hydrolase (beta-lactamase superfamily II)|nr:MBL fold metallo-hydrolase [Tannerellaceae bacterium]
MKNYFILFTIILFTAGAGAGQSQSAGLFRYKAGQYSVVTLTESQGQGNKGILVGATPEMIDRYAPGGAFPMATHAYLVQSGGRNVLVDAGMGKLASNIELAGLTPMQIDGVLLTHCHGDHIGGLLANGKAAFPNAHLYLSKKEYDYWLSAPRGDQARSVFAAYDNRIHLFEPGAMGSASSPIIPGFTAFAAYGHTPGHTVFLLESGREKLLIWGDLTHALAIQAPCPEVAVTYDVDPADAVRSRKEILKYVAANGLPVAGMHIPGNGIGKVESAGAGEGYRFVAF